MRVVFIFFFNDTATTEIYTLSLHDALPICPCARAAGRRSPVSTSRWRPRPERVCCTRTASAIPCARARRCLGDRSEEHTSELQSRQYLVCRLLLEKKKNSSYIV